MKYRKITAGVLAGVMALSMAIPAMAEDGNQKQGTTKVTLTKGSSSDYTLTVPAETAVTKGGLTQLVNGLNVKGDVNFSPSKKVVVTASSKNGWAFCKEDDIYSAISELVDIWNSGKDVTSAVSKLAGLFGVAGISDAVSLINGIVDTVSSVSELYDKLVDASGMGIDYELKDIDTNDGVESYDFSRNDIVSENGKTRLPAVYVEEKAYNDAENVDYSDVITWTADVKDA